MGVMFTPVLIFLFDCRMRCFTFAMRRSSFQLLLLGFGMSIPSRVRYAYCASRSALRHLVSWPGGDQSVSRVPLTAHTC